MKRRILSILLTMCMVLTLMPTMTVRADDTHTDHCICGASHTIVGDHNAEKKPSDEGKEWTEWGTDNSLPDSAGYYYLTTNVTLNSSWSPVSGTVLCLNGHTITGTARDTMGNGFIVLYGDFTLTDCKANEGRIVKDIENWGACICSFGTFNMYGGKITNNSFSGVSNYGTFTMSGGNITGNTTNGIGGGVYNSATFEMSGGSITENNVFENGGGVYNDGTFNVLYTAIVKNNTIGNTTANNVYLPGSKVITISNALYSGTSIGVTMENPPTEGNSVAITDGADDGFERYFFSDDAAYETYYDSNKIKMKLKEACSHSGSKVAGQAATCTEDGWNDYYHCPVCGKDFSDVTCQNEISDIAA